MLEQIKEKHDGEFDYIMLTGDFPGHDSWRQGREANLGYTKAAVQEILQIFPDTPVYPSLGNHESFPCNRFDLLFKNRRQHISLFLYLAIHLQR